MKNVFITDLRGFANPAIAERLGKAGARVVGCDPAIARDGDELGVEVLGWASPADLVSRAAERFDGRLDAIVISPAMPAPRVALMTIFAGPPSVKRGGKSRTFRDSWASTRVLR